MIETTVATSLELGEAAPRFEGLIGADGNTYGLTSFENKPLLVMVFISNGCPTVRVYDERLIALQAAHAERGVQILAINSNNPYLSPPDVYPELVKRAEQAGYNFPYVKDENGRVARSYGAVSTPHVFVFDSERCLRYRGRIDDSRDPTKITSNDLQNALRNLEEGREVEVPETLPFGCAIVR